MTGQGGLSSSPQHSQSHVPRPGEQPTAASCSVGGMGFVSGVLAWELRRVTCIISSSRIKCFARPRGCVAVLVLLCKEGRLRVLKEQNQKPDWGTGPVAVIRAPGFVPVPRTRVTLGFTWYKAPGRWEDSQAGGGSAMQCRARLPQPTSAVHPAPASPAKPRPSREGAPRASPVRARFALSLLVSIGEMVSTARDRAVPACALPSGARGRYHLRSAMLCSDTAGLSGACWESSVLL